AGSDCTAGLRYSVGTSWPTDQPPAWPGMAQVILYSPGGVASMVVPTDPPAVTSPRLTPSASVTKAETVESKLTTRHLLPWPALMVMVLGLHTKPGPISTPRAQSPPPLLEPWLPPPPPPPQAARTSISAESVATSSTGLVNRSIPAPPSRRLVASPGTC